MDRTVPLPVEEPTPLARRIRLGIIAGGLLTVGLVLAPAVPHEQHLELRLGSFRHGVTALTARLGRAGEWERQVTWHYGSGAPRRVDWRFDSANGASDLEIELRTPEGVDLQRHSVDLDGKDVEVPLSDVSRDADLP